MATRLFSCCSNKSPFLISTIDPSISICILIRRLALIYLHKNIITKIVIKPIPQHVLIFSGISQKYKYIPAIVLKIDTEFA